MNTYLKFGVLMSLIVGSLVWLAFSGVKDTKTYYKTIPELEKMGAQAQGQRLRVGGEVEAGSIVKSGNRVSFQLRPVGVTQTAQILNVVYTGTDPLPDTFKDNSQALADGRLSSNGVFEANKIQAKCASKYEPKLPQHVTHESASVGS